MGADEPLGRCGADARRHAAQHAYCGAPLPHPCCTPHLQRANPPPLLLTHDAIHRPPLPIVHEFCQLLFLFLPTSLSFVKIHVRRQRLPKNWTTRTDVNSGGEGGEADGGNGCGGFVGELDLAVGQSVYVWGREMKLVGCDPFTRAYYRRGSFCLVPVQNTGLFYLVLTFEDQLQDERLLSVFRKYAKHTKKAKGDIPARNRLHSMCLRARTRACLPHELCAYMYRSKATQRFFAFTY